MTLAYAAYLGLKVRVTNVAVQKYDRSLLANYGMVISDFQVVDTLGRFQFFQEIFLLANISMKVVLGMSFLTFSNVDVQFAKKSSLGKPISLKKLFQLPAKSKSSIERNLLKRRWMRILKLLWWILSFCNRGWLSTQRKKLNWFFYWLKKSPYHPSTWILLMSSWSSYQTYSQSRPKQISMQSS